MILAIDIGSSKTIVALLNNRGEITKSTKFKTPSQAFECLNMIKASVAGEFSNDKFEKIVVAVPGVVKDNKVAWCSNLGPDWQNFDIVKHLKTSFGMEVLLENDANLAGISEASLLNSSSIKSVIYLNIGAGIGSSFIINNKLVHGLLNSEAGMTMLEYDGIIREWEKFASGKAIKEAYDRKASEIKDAGAWRSIADRISRGLLVLIPIVQPDLIIIGGSMGNYFKKYRNHLTNLIAEKLPKELHRPSIISASNPDEAVINGCFKLATENIYLTYND